MVKINSESAGNENETLVFNAFSRERFFEWEDVTLATTRSTVSIDKFIGIDEMLIANITQLTYRSRQE